MHTIALRHDIQRNTLVYGEGQYKTRSTIDTSPPDLSLKLHIIFFIDQQSKCLACML